MSDPAARAPIDARAAGWMTLLCLVWALQQVVIKAATPDVTSPL